MPESNPDPCDTCGIRPASIHLCDGSAKTSRNLCEECLARESPSAQSWMDEARNAKCEYCGGSASGGGTDTIGQITGAPLRFRWMCASCSMEHHAHLMAEMTKIPDGLPIEQQMEALKKIAAETESHMTRFVAMRDN